MMQVLNISSSGDDDDGASICTDDTKLKAMQAIANDCKDTSGLPDQLKQDVKKMLGNATQTITMCKNPCMKAMMQAHSISSGDDDDYDDDDDHDYDDDDDDDDDDGASICTDDTKLKTMQDVASSCKDTSAVPASMKKAVVAMLEGQSAMMSVCALTNSACMKSASPLEHTNSVD